MANTTQAIMRLIGERAKALVGTGRARNASNLAADFELVKVIDRSMLLNPVQIRRPYRTRSGRPLERGIYAVVWPPDMPSHRYDGDASFYGPFRAWREASAFVRDTVGVHP